MGKPTYRLSLILTGLLLLLNTGRAYALELTITGNGDGSVNEVNTSVYTTTTIEQINNADVQNDVNIDSNTGENVASDNLGNVVIETGDINTDLALQTSVNSSTSESGCCPSDITANINGNGQGSNNSVNIGSSTITNVFVDQQANITNSVSGQSNTGDNVANTNSGNIVIDTGNINTSIKLVNEPINLASASVLSGVGDIYANISENVENSHNELNAKLENYSTMFINSSSDIDNYIVWDANTGGNEVNDNTGDAEIVTGDIDIEILIKNLANLSEAEVVCCDIFDPGDPDEDGDDDQQDGGGPSEKGGSSGSSGSTLSETAAAEAGGPGIAGLSDTGSAQARQIFYYLGFLLILLGVKNLGKSLEAKRLELNPSNHLS